HILGGLSVLLISEVLNAIECRATIVIFAELRRVVLSRGFKLGVTFPYFVTKLSVLSDSLICFVSLTVLGDLFEARDIVI
ncbi:septation ring formation regulator EzrA, partial [Listeria monocytogenes]